MDSSAAQDVRKAPGGEERHRSDPVNRIARAKLREGFERANPEPVAVLGPVPPVKDQMAELMRDPGWILARMKESQEIESVPDEFDDLDALLDEEDDLHGPTPYEILAMEPIPLETTEPEAREPSPPEGGSTQVEGEPPPVVSSTGDASTS